MDMCFRKFEASGAVFKLRVLLTESKDYFLGLLVSKIRTSNKHTSGFSLNAPSELKHPESNIGMVMNAIYPAPDKIKEKVEAKNLDLLK
jgi:hypothetical protein